MNKSRLLGALCAWTLSCATFSVNAALVNRGGGLIYDDVLDITWLQDANYAMTNGDDTDGRRSWSDANTWADKLSYYDSVRDVTYDDWRLPTLSPIDGMSFNTVGSTDGTTDFGYAFSAGWLDDAGNPVSEMGHMFFVNLGNIGFCNPNLPWCSEQPGWGLNNTGLFVNLQAEHYYADTAFDSIKAWNFNFFSGDQGAHDNSIENYAWAVRAGDVSAVPLPAAVWLFGSGLIGLLGLARRKR